MKWQSEVDGYGTLLNAMKRVATQNEIVAALKTLPLSTQKILVNVYHHYTSQPPNLQRALFEIDSVDNKKACGDDDCKYLKGLVDDGFMANPYWL